MLEEIVHVSSITPAEFGPSFPAQKQSFGNFSLILFTNDHVKLGFRFLFLSLGLKPEDLESRAKLQKFTPS